jgi:beta-glucanase (GH16 family)
VAKAESILQCALASILSIGLLSCTASEAAPGDAAVVDGSEPERPRDGGDEPALDAFVRGPDASSPDASEPEPPDRDDGGAPESTPFEPVAGKDGSQFVPVWNDEFEGSAVDTSKWYVQDSYRLLEPENEWRRNWKAKNVSVEEGALVIKTVREDDGSFSTGAVKTGGYGDTPWLFSQAFGRFEARVKLPTQQGHWPAFWGWTPGTDGVDGSGRDGSEIDIFEGAYRIDRVNHALHWDGYAASHQIASHDVEGRGLNDGDWHTFALEWYPDEYVFYIDGVESWRTAAGGVCQVPVYFKLTDEIGHYGTGPTSWGVGPIEDAVLPDYYRVDYVRAWRFEPAP